MAQTIIVQINQTYNTAWLQNAVYMLNDIKTSYKKIFQNKTDPNKIKHTYLGEGLSNIFAKKFQTLIGIICFGIIFFLNRIPNLLPAYRVLFQPIEHAFLQPHCPFLSQDEALHPHFPSNNYDQSFPKFPWQYTSQN
jgi:hypothetical protein